MSINIAIDGPAGAGKSTIARKAAETLNFIYVDTGAMYRALAVGFLRQNLAPEDEAGISKACENASVSIDYVDGMQQVFLNGENVTGLLRTEEVSHMASASSVYPAVRSKLLKLQRDLAAAHNVIMDGRDIGTVILPHAQIKIFLTASVAVRAMRRFKEQKAKGLNVSLEEIAKEIEERDYRDMHRETSPLKQAEDAVLLDTSDMTIDEVVEAILALYHDYAD